MLKHVEIGGMAWQLVLPWHLDFQCPELPRHLATGFGLAAVGSGEGCRPQAAACICYSVSCSRDDYINFIVKPRHCWLLKSQSLDVYTGWNLSKQASTSSQGYPKSLETAKKQTIHLGRAKKAVVFSKQPATWLAGLAACLTFRAMQNDDVTKRDQLSDGVQALQCAGCTCIYKQLTDEAYCFWSLWCFSAVLCLTIKIWWLHGWPSKTQYR